MTNTVKKSAMRTSGAASNRSTDVAARAAAADTFVNEVGKAPVIAEQKDRRVTVALAAELEDKLRLVAFQRRCGVSKIARELLEDAIREKL
jgi:hypothetical protein